MEARKSHTSSVAGVNRRTAVLFGNKTPRRNVPKISTQLPAPSPSGELRTPRRPGRPPKHPPHAVAEATKTNERTTKKQSSVAQEHQEQTSGDVVPKKRGRKKRSAVESTSKEFGSQWGEVVGSITTEWSAVARPETTSSTRRTPQKESFRQYRVMHDSDAEGASKSDNNRQMASVSSSSSSSDTDSDNDNSSHSDDDDGDDDGDVSTSSSSNTSPTGNSGSRLSVSHN